MKKRNVTGIKICPTVVNLGGIFYALRVTRNGTMMRLLASCDTGKGGKTRFIKTTPINIKGSSGEADFRRYILSAKRNWSTYEPMEFLVYEKAEDFLADKLGIDHDLVSFRPW